MKVDRMTTDRKARIANGLIVVLAALLAIYVDPLFVWVVLLMGVSLIFSGMANFCGFAVIFDHLSRRGH